MYLLDSDRLLDVLLNETRARISQNTRSIFTLITNPVYVVVSELLFIALSLFYAAKVHDFKANAYAVCQDS